MALFTHLKSFCAIGNRLKIKCTFHSFSKRLYRNDPPVGSRSLWRIFRPPSQADLKKADDIPDAFELIYRNKMSRYILGAQIVSVVTGGLVLMAFVMTDLPEVEKRTLEWTVEAKPTENQEMYLVALFIVFLALMQAAVSQMPVRIYKKPSTDKYFAVNYGNYFFGKERYTFRRGEISRLPERGILPWKGDRFIIRRDNFQKRVILLDIYFRRPADLHIMLGEQRDPDLEDGR